MFTLIRIYFSFLLVMGGYFCIAFSPIKKQNSKNYVKIIVIVLCSVLLYYGLRSVPIENLLKFKNSESAFYYMHTFEFTKISNSIKGKDCDIVIYMKNFDSVDDYELIVKDNDEYKITKEPYNKKTYYLMGSDNDKYRYIKIDKYENSENTIVIGIEMKSNYEEMIKDNLNDEFVCSYIDSRYRNYLYYYGLVENFNESYILTIGDKQIGYSELITNR